jgi:hypothetical protein
MNPNITDRQRWLVIAAASMVALYLLDSIVVEPLTKLWKTHSAEITLLRNSVTAGRATIARAAQTERVWAEMQANALPKDPTQAEQEVGMAINRWIVANNIEVTSFRSQFKRGGTDKYSLYECRIDAIGNLSTISRFIYELEHSPMALRVDSLELTSRDDGGSKLTLGLIITGLRLAPLERKQQ